MNPVRLLFSGILILGLATAFSLHAGGALDSRDALTAATLTGGVAGSPPAPFTSRALALGVEAARLVWSPTGLFRAMHLAAGVLLALAAALGAAAAARGSGRFADSPVGPGLGAGLAVGLATLFGADLGLLGLRGSPLVALLPLLAGATLAWIAPRPLAFWGGLFLGAATAEHPIVLFLLPGFGGLVMGAPLRLSPGESRGFVRRASLGFACGLAGLALPMLAASGRPLMVAADVATLGGAIALWWGSAGEAFWRFAPPSAWGAGFLDALGAVWRNAGPLGTVLGFAGILGFFAGNAPRFRPFLLIHGVIAAAFVVGRFQDAEVARALAGWTFLFWMIPSLLALHARLDAKGPGGRTAIVGAAVGVTLFGLHVGDLDRSAERDTDWARSTLDWLPPDACLVTRNPVHLALAVEGDRPDVRLIYPPASSTLRAESGGETIPGRTLPPGPIGRLPLVELVGRAANVRPVALDPSVYFDLDERAHLLGENWTARPWGPAFLLESRQTTLTQEGVQEALGPWLEVDLMPGSPASPLRDGLTGSEFYFRGLLQSGAAFEKLDFQDDAELNYLMALSHPEANRTLAAFGLARTLFRGRSYAEATRTLQTYTQDEDPGAWAARRMLANLLIQSGMRDEARQEVERALRLLPEERVEERSGLQATLELLAKPPKR